MLRNLMEVLGAAAPQLRHVTLLQGAKAYGSHLGGFLTPAREDDPRHMPPNFYYDQDAPPQRIPLAEFMADKTGDDKAGLWAGIARRHGLLPIPYRDLVSWPFGEFILNREFDHLLDTTKLRDHGFEGYEDSFRMFDRQIELLRRHRVIPA